MTRVKLLFAICCAAAMLAIPQTALGLGPVTTPKTFFTEGFESAVPVTYVPAPYELGGGLTPGYWKRVSASTNVAVPHGGVSSLWCDGTNTTQLARTPKLYAPGSQGYATFNLTQTIDYYKPVVEFYYTFPSAGYSDRIAFAPEWTTPGARGVSSALNRVEFPTAVNTWKRMSIDLASETTSETSLSRTEGSFRFRWRDEREPYADPPRIQTGQGPSVDDVTVAGWKFGPVRSLSAITTSISSTLTWMRPMRSATPTETSTEERPLSYRVWRAPKGTTAWTELTPAVRFANADAAVTYTDTTITDGTAYTYAVQAWGPGIGDDLTVGYGEHVSVNATAMVFPLPLVSISSPASGTVIVGADPVSVTGTVQALQGATVSSVMLAVRREDGAYLNRAAGTWAMTYSTFAAAVAGNAWSSDWTPSTSDNRVHTYTITAVAKDSRNKSASAAAAVKVTLSADTVGPRIVSARSLGRYAIEVRFTEPPFAPAGAGPIDSRYFSARGLRLRKIIGWSNDGTRVRIMTSAQPATHGSLRVTLRKPIVDALGN